jgi:hypothetical protein
MARFANPSIRRFESYPRLHILLGYGVIGNTTDFDSVVLGSNPSSPAKNKRSRSTQENTATLACPGGMSVTKQLGKSPYG